MPQMDIESRASRRHFTQCQNCSKNKDTDPNVKLLLCGGCKIATYCSAKCQKAHWRVHKSMCKSRQDFHDNLAEKDKEVREALQTALITSQDVAKGPIPLPSELLAELRAFTQKFTPALFQAGFNCLQVEKYPALWTQMVCWVNLDRVPDPDLSSRPWSRFTVNFIGPLPVSALMKHFGTNAPRFVEQKKAQEEEHRKAGNLGTITCVLSARCAATTPPTSLHNIRCIGFGSHSRDELMIEASWQETFIETVQKMCGRSMAVVPTGSSPSRTHS